MNDSERLEAMARHGIKVERNRNRDDPNMLWLALSSQAGYVRIKGGKTEREALDALLDDYQKNPDE